MPADPLKARALFLHAVGQVPPDQWERYVAEACGGDAELEQRVGHMLRLHLAAGSFLERPAVGGVTVPAPRPTQGTALYRPAGDDAPGSVIGPYKLLQQLGEGGMGAVFMAEQTHPVQRKVALKLVKTGMDSKSVLARFEAERQALALMDHPNIARVFDAGTTDRGLPYFVMELVKGVPITTYCDDHQLTCEERLGLFVSVCQAVQHAHQKGIIHRDIKPSNVMVCLYDGEPVPKVIDFGIAKATGQRLTDKTLFTEVGAVVGTLQYMSPEQAEVNQLDVDTRSDVYSLGVLLYELLTGTTPLERNRLKAVALLEVLRLIREEEPPRPSTRLSTTQGLPAIAAKRGLEPRRLNGVVRGELDWIVMKALEKDRNRRYETANGFAMDVRRFLADEPVQACPPSAGYRFRKFARRNKPALVTVAAAAVVVLIVVAGLATSNFLITREQRETTKALHDANVARDDLKRTNELERVEAYFRRIALAHAALSVNDLGGALVLLEDCPVDLRGWEWRYLMRLCCVKPVLIRTRQAAHSIAFDSGGERLASAGGDGAVRVWNSRTGQMIRLLENAHQGFACSVAFHPEGNHLVSVGADGWMRVWDLTTGRAVFDRPCDATHPFGTAYAAAFSPLDPDHVAVGCDGTVTIWNWRTEARVHAFPGHDTDRISVAFSPDGRQLATGNWQGTVKLWDAVAGGTPLHTFTRTGRARHPVAALAFTPDGTRLAAANFDRCVDVWDTTTGQLAHTLPHPGGLVLGVAYSRDGRLLGSVGEDKVVRVWDARTNRELLGLRGHAGMCGCLAFSPDGLRLASAGTDGTIRLWDATPLRGDERQEAATFAEHGTEIWSLAVGPDGKKIVSGGFGPPIMVWDAETRRVRARFRGHGVVVFCVAWHPDGHRFASAGSDNGEFSVKVWNATTREDVFTLRAPTRPEFFAVAFSPDGKYLVTGKGNGLLQVWDANNGEPIRTLGTNIGPVRGIVFSRDGRRLATVSAAGAVKLWDATALGEKNGPQEPLPPPLSAHIPGPCLNVAFSPDGKWLAIGDKEYTVKVCNVETGAVLHTLRGHNGDVHTVAFSPDGRWVASAGEDSTVKVWSARTGKIVRNFRGHKGLVTSLAFCRAGEHVSLISASRDHTAKIWDLGQLEDGPEE
jgi:WD40 repeat protein/serine/threonine protein kinase